LVDDWFDVDKMSSRSIWFLWIGAYQGTFMVDSKVVKPGNVVYDVHRKKIDDPPQPYRARWRQRHTNPAGVK
jgi:hypothetical protein